ncbi:uncharacterized protein LOC143197052 [Rhynchophorus ferrugineus]|uniref:uncharacterized protein LOC143197052 n=1 Tax=Rhynchophorus ferrugineus TaxID=354439 RepID=UPI003FCCAC1F
MDDDNDPSNWILVEKKDCFEDKKNKLAASNTTIQESDHESDSSISILSDFPGDSFSEEDTIKCNNENRQHNVTELLMTKEEEVAINKIVDEIQDENDQIKDDSISPNSENSIKQWTFVGDKSKLQLNVKEKPFFLDCSQEPILEISDIDTESIINGPESKALIQQEPRNVSVQCNLSRNGMFVIFIVLCTSILLKFYVDQTDIDHYPSSPILDNIPAADKDIVTSCMRKQKTKATADGFIERCVIKHLKKKKKDIVKSIKLYLEIHEWILEKKIKEKENEVFKKWERRAYTDNLKKENIKMKRQNKNSAKNTENKKTKRVHLKVNNSDSNKINKTRVKQKWKNEKLNRKVNQLKKKLKNNFKVKIKPNQDDIYDETELKDEFKQIFSKISLKYGKHNKNAAEWYVKYNPAENDIVIINITDLASEDFVVMRNGNNSLDGSWYFNLYRLSRSNFRKIGVDSHIYMINQIRKGRKAKWYFEYMTARDDYRRLYSSVYDF